jgi:hypothetical protein
MQAVPKLPILLALTALTGCASIFRSSPPSARIIAPAGIEVYNNHGEQLTLHQDGDDIFIYPEKGRDDSITIGYHGKRQSLGLAQRMSPWILLDLLSYGPGFVIDDASRWWYSYNPIYVHADSSGSFDVSSSNWLGEPAGRKRPELLLLGGIGIAMHIQASPAPIGENPFPTFPTLFVNFEGGIGVDLYKKIELFYLAQDEPEYDLEPGGNVLGVNFGPSAEITSQSIAARYFVKDNFFIQSSLGWAYAEVDTLGAGTFYQTYSNPIPVIGAAIGWAGDISYVALQYSGGTKRFSVDGYESHVYRSIYLDFGLNLRF